jgi:ABC-type transport system involved in Fe-S cluster assembly fused permease/ATPase subunit
MNTNCTEEKKRFTTNVKNMIIFLCVILLVYGAYYSLSQNTQKTLEAFLNHQELICHNKIVSQNKGYIYDTNTQRLTDGDNIFVLRQCTIKEQ